MQGKADTRIIGQTTRLVFIEKIGSAEYVSRLSNSNNKLTRARSIGPYYHAVGFIRYMLAVIAPVDTLVSTTSVR